jgi:hypothetical protein
MQAGLSPDNVYCFCLLHIGKRVDKHFFRHVLSFRITGPHAVGTPEVTFSCKDNLDHVHLPFLIALNTFENFFEINPKNRNLELQGEFLNSSTLWMGENEEKI